MTTDRDRILSEFLAAWTAGHRPDVRDHLRSIEDDAVREELADDIRRSLGFVPTPDFDDSALDAIRADPIVAEALDAAHAPGGVFATRLRRLRALAALSTRELAAGLAEAFGFAPAAEAKAARYLEELEAGRLEPSRVRAPLLDSLASLLRVPAEQLRAAASFGSQWAPPGGQAAAPVFRADVDAAAAVRDDLELLADAAAMPSERDWDEVDELFRGG